MSLARLLASMDNEHDDDRDERSSRITPPEVLCLTLREVAERYNSDCAFKVGDLVTPRAHYNVRGAGRPHVVVEVFATPVRNYDCVESVSDIASQAFGSKNDIRVVAEDREQIVPFVVESWKFEPYTGPGSKAEKN